jgi:hypothetical protein
MNPVMTLVPAKEQTAPIEDSGTGDQNKVFELNTRSIVTLDNNRVALLQYTLLQE